MKKTLIRITTVPMAFKVLLAGQPRFMSKNGFNVIMVSADGKELEDVKRNEGCEHIIVPMTRKITPLRDISCFFKLRKLMKKYRPDIVHTHTPKAGLLGMLAAKSLGIKTRIHTVAGLPLMVETGIKKQILLFTERLTYGSATHVWPNSRSMMDFIKNRKLVNEKKLSIINNGSTNGVDLNKFSKQNLREDIKKEILQTLPPTKGLRILCVGRMVKDKGIEELVSAFIRLTKQYSFQLILVGPFEPHLDPLSIETQEIIADNPYIVHIDWSDAVEYYMSAADIFIHPSHREGFPNVILQAGAMQLPVVCSDIPGNTDIVENDKTGFIFAAKDEEALYRRLKDVMDNREKAIAIAQSLHQEIVQLYARDKMYEAILGKYKELLKTNLG